VEIGEYALCIIGLRDGRLCAVPQTFPSKEEINVRHIKLSHLDEYVWNRHCP